MSIEQRIEALEAKLAYGDTSNAGEHNPERERIIEKLKASQPALEEKMAREEAKGDFTRRRALEELEEQVERRMRGDHR
jgi:hypothetical protein